MKIYFRYPKYFTLIIFFVCSLFIFTTTTSALSSLSEILGSIKNFGVEQKNQQIQKTSLDLQKENCQKKYGNEYCISNENNLNRFNFGGNLNTPPDSYLNNKLRNEKQENKVDENIYLKQILEGFQNGGYKEEKNTESIYTSNNSLINDVFVRRGIINFNPSNQSVSSENLTPENIASLPIYNVSTDMNVNPLDAKNVDLNHNILKQVPSAFISGWGVIGYKCGVRQFDPGTAQNGCAAGGPNVKKDPRRFDAFNCSTYVGIGASQKYISLVFRDVKSGLGQLVEVRSNGRCIVVPIVDTNQNSSTVVQKNGSTFDASYALLKKLGYENPNKVGTGIAKLTVRALVKVKDGGEEEACGQKIDQIKKKEIIDSIPISKNCGKEFAPNSCIATSQGAVCN